MGATEEFIFLAGIWQWVCFKWVRGIFVDAHYNLWLASLRDAVYSPIFQG
jgi:hypothetical protein